MFKPGKMVMHSNKGHSVQHFSQGGLVSDRGERLADKGRQSGNVEDRRNERPPWNQRALDAIDKVDNSRPSFDPPDERPRDVAGVNGRTPANGGLDDYLNTRQFRRDGRIDVDGLGAKSGPEVTGTATPDNQDRLMDDDDRPRGATPNLKRGM